MSVAEEACPLNLAPTASTTATLAIGDALAVALLEARGFTSQDFARSHPGGALGRKLLLHVADVMRTGDDLPVVGPGQFARRRPGRDVEEGSRHVRDRREPAACSVCSPTAICAACSTANSNVHKTAMREVMTSPGKSVQADASSPPKPRISWRNTASPRCRSSMTQGALVGALNVHDLLRAGVL